MQPLTIKRIMQPIGKKQSRNLLTQKNGATSWHKKIMQLLNTKKIMQPLCTKKSEKSGQSGQSEQSGQSGQSG